MHESLRTVLRFYLLEGGVSAALDSPDAGAAGKKFESTFIEALQLVGLDFSVNVATGAAWDIKPKGRGWKRLLVNKDVNIKVTRALWLFGGAEFARILPWDKIDDEGFDLDQAAKGVEKALRKRGLHKVVFLKPATTEVENAVSKATKKKDVAKLNDLLVKKNFRADTIGDSFSVRVTERGGRIGSIAIVSGGRVFGRSERPRSISGSMFVGFRRPKKMKPSPAVPLKVG
jgi:hypothetical protein